MSNNIIKFPSQKTVEADKLRGQAFAILQRAAARRESNVSPISDADFADIADLYVLAIDNIEGYVNAK